MQNSPSSDWFATPALADAAILAALEAGRAKEAMAVLDQGLRDFPESGLLSKMRARRSAKPAPAPQDPPKLSDRLKRWLTSPKS